MIRELKSPKALFFPTDDPRILWLKYQILVYFKGLKTIEVRPGNTKSQRNKKCSYNPKSENGIKINVHTLIEQTYKVFDYE